VCVSRLMFMFKDRFIKFSSLNERLNNSHQVNYFHRRWGNILSSYPSEYLFNPPQHGNHQKNPTFTSINPILLSSVCVTSLTNTTFWCVQDFKFLSSQQNGGVPSLSQLKKNTKTQLLTLLP